MSTRMCTDCPLYRTLFPGSPAVFGPLMPDTCIAVNDIAVRIAVATVVASAVDDRPVKLFQSHEFRKVVTVTTASANMGSLITCLR